MKKVILGFVVLLGLSTLVFGFGGGKQGYHGGYHKGGIFRTVYQLDLSDEQITKIEDIKKSKSSDFKRKFRKQRREAKKNKKSNFSDASKYLSADSFDRDTFIELATTKAKEREEAKAKSRESFRTTRINAKADNIQKIFDVLTKEQRSELIILLEK